MLLSGEEGNDIVGMSHFSPPASPADGIVTVGMSMTIREPTVGSMSVGIDKTNVGLGGTEAAFKGFSIGPAPGGAVRLGQNAVAIRMAAAAAAASDRTIARAGHLRRTGHARPG